MERIVLSILAALYGAPARAFYMMSSVTTMGTPTCPRDDLQLAGVLGCGVVVDGDTRSGTLLSGIQDCGAPVSSAGIWYSFEDSVTDFNEVTLTVRSFCNQTPFQPNMHFFLDNDDCFPTCAAGFEGAAPNCPTSDGEIVRTLGIATGSDPILIFVSGAGGSAGQFSFSTQCFKRVDESPPGISEI